MQYIDKYDAYYAVTFSNKNVVCHRLDIPYEYTIMLTVLYLDRDARLINSLDIRNPRSENSECNYYFTCGRRWTQNDRLTVKCDPDTFALTIPTAEINQNIAHFISTIYRDIIQKLYHVHGVFETGIYFCTLQF